ncbi:MAG TPA: alpha/beta fold hydrolase [Candidatus Binatia bacterium]|nr:alpha/beta fold hydrolase [Candidatus Binatia bacterium]
MPSQSSTLVYLIHGVTGTPMEMKYLARQLRHQGWDVYLPTCPGHCSTLRDLLRSNEEMWLGHVRTQLSYVRRHYQNLFAIGLSAGALLALEASISVPLQGIGALSPTFFYDGWNVPWTQKLLRVGIKWFPSPLHYIFFHFDRFPYGIKNPALQARLHEAYHPVVRSKLFLRRILGRSSPGVQRRYSPEAVGYPVFFLKTLADLDRLYVKVREDLHYVTAPTLIIQARDDDFTSPKNSELVYRAISSSNKKLILLDDCYHVITVDQQREAVARELAKFIHSHLNRSEDFELSASGSTEAFP